MWSPIENNIFYVFGYTFGTLSIGGDIYLADLEGNSSSVVVVDRDNKEEVYRNFRIAGDTLYYKVVHHLDDQYMKREFSLRKFSLSDL